MASPARPSLSHAEDEESAAAAAAQRCSRVEYLVDKRVANLAYLQRVHGGGVHWLNCSRLSQADILRAEPDGGLERRCVQFFYLALSLSRLLKISSTPALVRAAVQLFDEWQYHFAGSAAQNLKWVLMRSLDAPLVPWVESEEPPVEPLGSRLHRCGNQPVYVFLQTPNVPFRLDYFQVIFSLCETMSQLYTKFGDPECGSNMHLYDGLVKVDHSVKKYIINMIAKECTDAAIQTSRTELVGLR